MSDVVQTLWGFCHTLRHDGIDYGDYIEQLTYLLFLKMADERGLELPKDCDWQITFGREDRLTSTRFADRLKAGIPKAEMVVFEGAAHAPIYERTEEFNRRTVEFLTKGR